MKLTEKQIKAILRESIRRSLLEELETGDQWEDAIYRSEQDAGYRRRYGIGAKWPHFDSEDYPAGIWRDDEGRAWTVHPGDHTATCLDGDDTFLDDEEEFINEAYGVYQGGKFLKDSRTGAVYGPTFTSFPEDALRFKTPEQARNYIMKNNLDDLGCEVASIPEREIYEGSLKEAVRRAVRSTLNEISYKMAYDVYDKACQTCDYNDPKQVARRDRLYQCVDDRSAQNFDPNMDVIVVGGPNAGRYKAGDLEQYFEVRGYVEPSPNPIYKNQKMVGYPRLKGLIGPMWDGDKIRYETQEVYDILSR